MSNHYNRDFHEELLLNGGGSITKMVDETINTDFDDELPDPFADQQKQFSGNIPDNAPTQKGSNTHEKAFRTKNIPASK